MSEIPMYVPKPILAADRATAHASRENAAGALYGNIIAPLKQGQAAETLESS